MIFGYCISLKSPNLSGFKKYKFLILKHNVRTLNIKLRKVILYSQDQLVCFCCSLELVH